MNMVDVVNTLLGKHNYIDVQEEVSSHRTDRAKKAIYISTMTCLNLKIDISRLTC